MHERIQRGARRGGALLLSAVLLAGCDAAAQQPPQGAATGNGGNPTAPNGVTIAPNGSPADAPTPGANVTLTLPTPAPTDTPAPTETAAPVLAARVNEADITIDAFNAEMARYLGDVDPASDAGKQKAAELKNTVLDDLIQKALLAQEAARQGIVITDDQIDDEVAFAQEKAGGADKFAAWLTANKLSELDARDMVRNELLGAALRDKVIAAVPRELEQVHAFHVLVATEAEAQQVLARLNAGAKLGPVARTVSIDDSTRADDGDLGWFAPGTGAILWPEVEAAAFALQPGETSGIVQSPVGFHIIRVTERAVRPLSESDLAALQQAALEKWMTQLQSQAKIERYV